jgi:hypothetical protein
MQFSKSFLKKSIGTNTRGQYYDNIRPNNIRNNNIETNNTAHFSDTNFPSSNCIDVLIGYLFTFNSF